MLSEFCPDICPWADIVVTQHAEDLESNPLQFQHSIMSSMTRRIPRMIEMDEKTLIILFTRFIVYRWFVHFAFDYYTR
jgi:hypothetical protein